MEAQFIYVAAVKSLKSENKVWAVAITGEEKPKGYCKSPQKALRLAFFLKKQTGHLITKKSFTILKEEIEKGKAEIAAAVKEKVEQIAEEKSVDKALAEKPKRGRKPRAKKEEVAQVAALQ